MLRIAVSFLIRLIEQYQRPNYPYSTHYRGNISPHRSRGLQINLPQKMFFCTGCMEIWSWLHLQVILQDIGRSNLFTNANPVPTKKRSQSSARFLKNEYVLISRVAEDFQIRSLEQCERPICHCVLCCRGNKFPHQSRKSLRNRLEKMILCSTYKEVSL